jgi:bifunctional non-homologous end joining protein LigD
MVAVSNADRVIFPDDGITKGDVVAHYERVGAAMLPHVIDRPLTLERFPKGIGDKGFMQKNCAKHFPPSIRRLPIEHQKRVTEYPVIDDAEALAYLANQGTVTFHVWTSRASALERPDRVIIDLDPPANAHEAVRKAAWLVRAMLDELGLPSAPVATGGKGYHVVCPIVANAGGDEVAELARTASELLTRRHPELLTSEFRKEKRKGRVFVDWLRNRLAQTVVAPWSLRPRKGAPVAVPIAWEELDETPPDRWSLGSVAERLGIDPLAGLAPVDIAPALAEVRARGASEGIELETFDRFRS